GYWIYLIIRKGEPHIANVGRTAQTVFRYIAIGVALILMMLLLYLEPSPLLSRLVSGISAVEAYGLKLQVQGLPTPSSGPKDDDYATKTRAAPVQSFEPALDSTNVAYYFLQSFAQNRKRDRRLLREITGQELHVDKIASQLMSELIVPAYGCLLQLEQ